MISTEDYNKMVEFFEERLFDTYECIKMNNFKKLNFQDHRVFQKYLKDGIHDILPFSSPLGNFYISKVGPKYDDWKGIKLISNEEMYGSTV